MMGSRVLQYSTTLVYINYIFLTTVGNKTGSMIITFALHNANVMIIEPVLLPTVDSSVASYVVTRCMYKHGYISKLYLLFEGFPFMLLVSRNSYVCQVIVI